MENVYGQAEDERNAAVGLPDGFAEKAGNTLYAWLGSLWRSVHGGDKMVRGLQAARGTRLAQLCLDAIESARLQDRREAPVFHRELWYPIVVRLSRRDTAQENMLEVGIDGDVGAQPAGSRYGEGTVFLLGRLANLRDYATYPVDAKIAGGARTIVDNVVNPKVRLERGTDFEIGKGSIVFRREDDPLGDGSAFDRHDVPGVLDDGGNEISDMEAVLWASDVLIDRNYVADHLSYALGANAPSSDVSKRIVNSAWGAVTDGLTPAHAKTLLAALLNIPAIQGDKETVRRIFREKDADGNDVATVVETDRGTYRVSLRARLRKDVFPGATLVRGDLLDESVRIYPFLDRVSTDVAGGSSSDGSSPDALPAQPPFASPFAVPVEEDVPSVTIPPGMLRARTEYGIYAMWDPVEVKKDEKDRLYFDVGGREDDVRAFWEDVWKKADASGTDLASVLGPAGAKISPAAFFLRNLVGANTLFVVVDRAQVDDTSMMRDPMFFDMLSAVVPSAIRLFLVEHRSVGEGDVARTGDARETCALAAVLPEAKDVAEPPRERVSMRFFRPPPAHVRGKREEENA